MAQGTLPFFRTTKVVLPIPIAQFVLQHTYTIIGIIDIFVTHYLATSSNAYPTISGLEVVGFSVLLTGVVFRLWAMALLGHLFTFDLTIRNQHKLITYGPYSLVRHPSYTGLTLLFIGGGILITSGNAMRVLVELPGVAKVVLGFMPWAYIFTRFGLRRIPSEERMLHGAFGKEWEAFAARTRYRIIPAVW